MKEKIHIEEYVPLKKTVPRSTIPVMSAWKGLELIIEDILDRFNIERESCIEFGVEFGFSSVVFSNYFKTVKGIDTFTGDIHTAHKKDHYEKTKNSLVDF